MLFFTKTYFCNNIFDMDQIRTTMFKKKKASSHSAIPVQKQGLVLSLPWKGNTRIQFLARFL